MEKYIELLIPFAIGLFMIFMSDSLIKTTTPEYENKKKKIKRLGYGLLGVTLLLAVAKYYSPGS
ncbi:hypothetical protein GFS24_12900 [Chitinophaga sp. SYP-B3965]|uniref:hypothetical protein n=1 Tax=Chitinophaga sp. SYP-B3965 TaxID=2663120 RepID=UPI001299D2B8|nr:hypothetical protein [Chitinophaga sp. SYP-B3965]MRG46019.1 hypothetical protein [Chitinophaga sp. SYP-B3965]